MILTENNFNATLKLYFDKNDYQLRNYLIILRYCFIF